MFKKTIFVCAIMFSPVFPILKKNDDFLLVNNDIITQFYVSLFFKFYRDHVRVNMAVQFIKVGILWKEFVNIISHLNR